MGIKILLLDDEKPALTSIEFAVKQAEPDAETHAEQNPYDALEYIRSNPVNVIMCDIEMPGMSGIEFAKQAKDILHNVNIIFVTAYSEYAVEAFRQRASGYLLKPVRIENVKKELENLRNPIAPPQDERLRAVCFGRFEVYAGDELVKFSRVAEKEILAYLIDLRGGGANTKELCGALWEDPDEAVSRKGYFRVLYNGLRKTLESYGYGDVLIKKQNYFAIRPELINCDYFDFIRGDVNAINSYHGEYMSQYGWSVMTLGELDDKYEESRTAE